MGKVEGRGVASFLRQLSDWTDGATRILLVPVGIGFILIVFLGVLTRYVFRTPIITSIELARVGFVWSCFLGAAICMKQEKHIQFVFLLDRLGARGREGVRLVVSALSAGFFLFVTLKGLEMVQAVEGTYFPAMGLSQVWLYLPVPVAGLCMLIHATAFLARDAESLRRSREEKEPR